MRFASFSPEFDSSDMALQTKERPTTDTAHVEPWQDDCGDGGAVLIEQRSLPREARVCDAYLSSPTPRPRRAGEPEDYDPHDTVAIRSLNLSRHGVGFVSQQPVPPATFHRIVIELGPTTVNCEVRIAHCAPCEDGYYVGAAFC